MFVLTKEDGLEPCPHCGCTKARVIRNQNTQRLAPNKVKLDPDGKLLSRHTVLYGSCSCYQCHAQGPRIDIHLPAGHKDKTTLRERDDTPQAYIDAIIELWNFRYPRDGELKRISFSPRESEYDG